MSSKAKRPTPGERLVRTQDILPLLQTMQGALLDLNRRVKALEPKDEPKAE